MKEEKKGREGRSNMERIKEISEVKMSGRKMVREEQKVTHGLVREKMLDR